LRTARRFLLLQGKVPSEASAEQGALHEKPRGKIFGKKRKKLKKHS